MNKQVKQGHEQTRYRNREEHKINKPDQYMQSVRVQKQMPFLSVSFYTEAIIIGQKHL